MICWFVFSRFCWFSFYLIFWRKIFALLLAISSHFSNKKYIEKSIKISEKNTIKKLKKILVNFKNHPIMPFSDLQTRFEPRRAKSTIIKHFSSLWIVIKKVHKISGEFSSYLKHNEIPQKFPSKNIIKVPRIRRNLPHFFPLARRVRIQLKKVSILKVIFYIQKSFI